MVLREGAALGIAPAALRMAGPLPAAGGTGQGAAGGTRSQDAAKDGSGQLRAEAASGTCGTGAAEPRVGCCQGCGWQKRGNLSPKRAGTPAAQPPRTASAQP